jgi:hypothetical protein
MPKSIFGRGFGAGNNLRWFATTQKGFGDIAGARKTIQLAYIATQNHDSPGIDYPRKDIVSALASTGDVNLGRQGVLDMSDDESHDDAVWGVANVQAWSGDFDTAMTTAKEIFNSKKHYNIFEKPFRISPKKAC